MVENVLLNPQETKYRSVKLANAAVSSRLACVRGGLQLASAVGFEQAGEELRLKRYDPAKMSIARDVLDQALAAH